MKASDLEEILDSLGYFDMLDTVPVAKNLILRDF
jgi:hypothetical protein